MSGRFFKHLSDSESESSESEDEVTTTKGPATKAPAAPLYSFSDEEEETQRVVRTSKEKRYEVLTKYIKQTRNYKKIKDFPQLLSAFEDITKAFAKAKIVIDKEDGGVTPKFYIKAIVDIADLCEESWEDRKNLSKNSQKCLTNLRQKIRKYLKDFEEEVTKYRENPEDGYELPDSDEEDEEEQDEPSDDEQKSVSASDDEGDEDRKKSKASAFFKDDKGGESDSDSDQDESDWGDSSESSLSSDDDKYGENLALKFLKRDKDEDKEKKDKEKKKREKKDRERAARRKQEKEGDEDDKEGEWHLVSGGTIIQERPKLFAKDEEITHEGVLNKIIDVIGMRDKKRIRRSDMMSMLNELIDLATQHNLGPAVEIKLLFACLSSLLSYSAGASSMKLSSWNKCLTYAERLLDVLFANPNLEVGESINEETESFVSAPYRVTGSPLTIIERVDDEFTKLLQSVDAHSPDYIVRLKDEVKVNELINRMTQYLEENKRGSSGELCRVYILKIDHLYYKFDSIGMKKKEQQMKKQQEEDKENNTNGVDNETVDEVIGETSLEIMDRLCKFIYSNDTTNRIRTQTMLFHIYHHALHDNWFEARDLMLMSHLQHNIQKADIPLHIIYNRALVQLGLCAFRHGNIKDAHTALLDIQIQGRAKELLAQGLLPRQQERTADQEKMEKSRLLPFHKHINLELLECVYLVSAMLLEIPDVAANEYSIRKKMISRSFYNQLRKNEEQPLVGLPESMREHVVAASKAMRVGNWRQCLDFIVNEKMNNKVWNLFHRPDNVRNMLARKIREESLRAYLFTYSHVYDSISLDVLSKMLDLEKETVHSIVSKMMTNEELMASLDEPTQTLVMHRTEPSRIQGLALQLADKINLLVEQNERLWEVKQTGSFGNQGRYDHHRREHRGTDADRDDILMVRGFGGQAGRKNWSDRLGYEDRGGQGRRGSREHGGRRGSRFDGRRQGGNRGNRRDHNED